MFLDGSLWEGWGGVGVKILYKGMEGDCKIVCSGFTRSLGYESH